MYKVRPATEEELDFLREIADYQFHVDIGEKLFSSGTLLKISRNTGKIREVLNSRGLTIATVRASTYTFVLKVSSALEIMKHVSPPKLRAVVADEVAQDIVKNGSTVFSRHILAIDENLRAGDEVIVTDESDNLLCVGRLVLSPYEILHFIRGPAIKVRECVKNDSG